MRTGPWPRSCFSLIRLQCYEGLDASAALYEWNYPKQLLYIRLAEQEKKRKEEIERVIYGEEFLIKRPLLQAIQSSNDKPQVLLIDEVDRSDEEFEAFLLEVLSDFQITIPEVGTIKARQRPMVVVTSNRTRDVHDALKRRCLYHWIDYPSFEKEYRIVMIRVPQIEENLAKQVAHLILKNMMASFRVAESRRFKRSKKPRDIDFRLILKRSLKIEGLPLDLFYRRRKKRLKKLVILADVSGSMDRYVRFLMPFLLGLRGIGSQSEVYVFSTSLTRITFFVRKLPVEKALSRISSEVPDW